MGFQPVKRDITDTALSGRAGQLDFSELIADRCRTAQELEETGRYEAARRQLRDVWRRIGERPDLSHLSARVAACVLLRAGTLSGWIGSARQIQGAQEFAKDLISESIERFAQLAEHEHADNARIDLAICYWREGAMDEARVLLRETIERAAAQPDVVARALVNMSVVEISAQRFQAALDALKDAWPLFELSRNKLARGRFHTQRGLAFSNLAAAENREDYFDRALEEYAMASRYFEEGGHMRYLARVENNVGNLLYSLKRYSAALSHMDRARALLITLKDAGTVAQINEARAKVFVALERYHEAEIAATCAVHVLEQGDETSLLAEALITHGIALTRLSKEAQARMVFQRAAEVAERGGDLLRAGQAHMTLIEELGQRLSPAELARHYKAADLLAGDEPDNITLMRLRSCAQRCLRPTAEAAEDSSMHASLIGGTLEQEVLHLEGELIRRALDKTQGRITAAARLLGTSHQALNYIIRARHRHLLAIRTPVQPRRHSIFKKKRSKKAKSSRQ